MNHHPDLRDLLERGRGLDHQPLRRRADRSRLRARRPDRRARPRPRVQRADVRFRSADAECAGWLYRPEDAVTPPAPASSWRTGSAAREEARLDAYAERFAGRRLRRRLSSTTAATAPRGGEPRLLHRRGRQHDDWRAAIAFARGLDGVDPERIVAWGTSFSGGHVVEIAAADHADRGRDRTVAVHERGRDPALGRPGAQPPAHRRRVARRRRRLASAARRHEIPVVGPPGSTAAMASPDAEPGYRALFPPGFEWPNRVPAPTRR